MKDKISSNFDNPYYNQIICSEFGAQSIMYLQYQCPYKTYTMIRM